jgi:hypothetical protein
MKTLFVIFIFSLLAFISVRGDEPLLVIREDVFRALGVATNELRVRRENLDGYAVSVYEYEEYFVVFFFDARLDHETLWPVEKVPNRKFTFSVKIRKSAFEVVEANYSR